MVYSFYQDYDPPSPIFNHEIQFYYGESIEAKELISNMEELPPETKVFWKEELEEQTEVAEVVVIYPDRTIYCEKITIRRIRFDF